MGGAMVDGGRNVLTPDVSNDQHHKGKRAIAIKTMEYAK